MCAQYPYHRIFGADQAWEDGLSLYYDTHDAGIMGCSSSRDASGDEKEQDAKQQDENATPINSNSGGAGAKEADAAGGGGDSGASSDQGKEPKRRNSKRRTKMEPSNTEDDRATRRDPNADTTIPSSAVREDHDEGISKATATQNTATPHEAAEGGSVSFNASADKEPTSVPKDAASEVNAAGASDMEATTTPKAAGGSGPEGDVLELETRRVSFIGKHKPFS